VTVAVSSRPRDLRIAAGALIGAAAVWPILPVHPPLACPLRSTTGIPCPFCGMTRACVAAVHGHLGESLRFNPGAIVLLVAAAVMIIRPSWAARVRLPTWSLWIGLGVLWIWNIGFNPTFHHYFA
jgi:hypothetical protein